MTLVVLRFVHYISMALWIAAALQVTAQLRALSNAPTPEQAKATPGSIGPTGHIAAVGSLGSGIGMIVLLGGMGAVPWPIHASLLLGLVLWGLLAFAERGLGAVHTAISGGDGSSDEISGQLRRYRLVTVGFHTTWTLVLVLMTFRYVIAG
ncbi:MAG: hypothetical protein AAF211_10950 [Myxococcota bacterium]